MRITRSRDRKYRATLRIDVRLDRTEFVDALALAAVKGHIADVDTVLDGNDLAALPERMSRVAIVRAIKNTIAQYGYDAPNWWEDAVDEEAQEALREWSESIIDTAFSEFSDG